MLVVPSFTCQTRNAFDEVNTTPHRADQNTAVGLFTFSSSGPNRPVPANGPIIAASTSTRATRIWPGMATTSARPSASQASPDRMPMFNFVAPLNGNETPDAEHRVVPATVDTAVFTSTRRIRQLYPSAMYRFPSPS